MLTAGCINFNINSSVYDLAQLPQNGWYSHQLLITTSFGENSKKFPCGIAAVLGQITWTWSATYVCAYNCG